MKETQNEVRAAQPAGLAVALAVAGLLLAGATTPLFTVDAAGSNCRVGDTCSGGTLFECGTDTDCVCDFFGGKTCKYYSSK